MSWEGSRSVGLQFEGSAGRRVLGIQVGGCVTRKHHAVVDEVTQDFVWCKQETREAKELG